MNIYDTISTIFTSKYSIGIIWTVLIVLSIITVCARQGLLKINTRHIQLGNSELERTIIRQQIEWSHLYVLSRFSKIKTINSTDYFVKYILERVYDKVVEWITFNHISTTSSYIEIKQKEIISLINSIVQEQLPPALKKKISQWTKDLIEHLVQIREVYSKK